MLPRDPGKMDPDVPKKKVLSHKEKKELKKKQKMEAELERITKKGGEGHSELGSNFTVAQVVAMMYSLCFRQQPFLSFTIFS